MSGEDFVEVIDFTIPRAKRNKVFLKNVPQDIEPERLEVWDRLANCPRLPAECLD